MLYNYLKQDNVNSHHPQPKIVILHSAFCYPWSAVVQKYLVEDYRNEQFISIKLWALLLKSHTVYVCPAWTMNQLFVQSIQTV